MLVPRLKAPSFPVFLTSKRANLDQKKEDGEKRKSNSGRDARGQVFNRFGSVPKF